MMAEQLIFLQVEGMRIGKLMIPDGFGNHTEEWWLIFFWFI